MKPLFAIGLLLLTSTGIAGELHLLKIEKLSETRSERGLSLTVEAWTECYDDYKGTLLEEVDEGILGQATFEVRAVAADRVIDCDGPAILVEDVILIHPITAGRYHFIAVNPE